MNELRKYATFSVDIIGNPIKVNSMFSIGRARIFYMGPNPNRSIIEGEVAKKLASTIPGTPIVGLYNYDTEDFEGHGDGQAAYGFVPLEPNPTWVMVNEDGKEREYLEVDVVIWDGRFEEAKSIIKDEKSLSMELNPATLKGTMTNIDNRTYYKIENAEFAGITVLGEDVKPCFSGAGFLNAYSSMVNAYAKYMSDIQQNEEGGINQMENIEEVQVEEVVETEVEAEEIAEVENAEVVEAESLEEEVVEEAAEEPVEEEPIETPAEEETEFACGDKAENAKEESDESEEDKGDDKDEEACPKCGKNPCVCENACGKDEKYSLLESEIADLKEKNESLNQELNAAREALKKYTRNEKLEIISKFSTKLEGSEELIAELTENVDELSKEEIKAELGTALIDQIEAEEAAVEEEPESNFSLNLNVNQSLRNDAWGLVDAYKNRK